MPDDMLEDSISIAKKTLDEHDFETDGVEVGINALFHNLDLFRLLERSRNTWMRSGSPIGTYSWESPSVVTQSMSETGSCTLLSSPARSPSSFTRRLEEGKALEEDVELRVICKLRRKPLYIIKLKDA